MFGLPGIGPGDALHGTAVVRKPDGTFQTLAAQQGKVTSVSATAITVKSDDGYSATYVVDKDTVVGPGGKLTDIKTGADVAVTATVTGATSTATRIIDLAGIKDRISSSWITSSSASSTRCRASARAGAPPPRARRRAAATA